MSRAWRRRLRVLPWVLVPLAGIGIGVGVWQRGPGGAPEGVPGAVVPGGVGAGGAPTAAAPVRVGASTFTKAAPEQTSSAAGTAPCPGCDVVVITVCSLRRDHVSGYGVAGHEGLTPSIDRIAADGWRMDNAWSASNFTLAGLSAILTGRFGSTTGVLTWDKGLTADIPTLPEILGYYGYATGGFTIDAPSGFRPDYGLDRGFQHMEIMPPPRDTPDGRTGGGSPGPGGDSARPAAAWLAKQSTSKPVFLMYHNRTAHFPFVLTDKGADGDPTGLIQALYDAGRTQAHRGPMPGTAGGTAQKGVVDVGGPDPLQLLVDRVGRPAVEAWSREYAASVRRMDVDIRVILDAVAARGRPTVLLLVADHGESLNEHGELLHGDAYWAGVTRVPLLIRIPGVAGGSSGALVSHVDLAPTLLEAVGAVIPAGIDGHSLLPVMRGESGGVRSVALIEGGVRANETGIARGAVVAPPWVLLRQDRGCGESAQPPRGPGEPASCLYNTEEDPGQLRSVAIENPAVVEELLGRWDRFRAARGNAGAKLELSPEAVEALQRTGYDFKPGER